MKPPGQRMSADRAVFVWLPMRGYDEQVASMQDWPAPHWVSSRQAGVASPGVSQKPPVPQMVAAVQVQQSELDVQLARQNPLTQLWPALQLVFEVQEACGRSSGVQRPAEHMSCGPQLESLVQAP